ncbi:hypothetical protein BV20DRAFT_990354 [Pilatotrama ljubarskyi]|nr:hypothetical protein BV20DRAFT_990354 [Pilatotrama ljubarskyi]
MPSLRRTLSSPSVRSSPYAYPSSSANANGHPTRTGNPQPRRSSGSDTANRRVLADIDWWLVHDRQRDFVAEPSGGEEDSDEQGAAPENVQPPHGAPNVVPSEDFESPAALPPPVAVAPSAGPAAGSFDGELASSPLWDVSTDDSSFGLSSPEPMSPLPQFASLSLAPRTPLRRHASVSSQSSVESSPEDALFALPTFLDVLRPAVPAYPPAFATSLAPRRPTNARGPALAMRSVSYSAVEFQMSSSRFGDDRFGDVVPSPPPFFSSTMDDNEMEDLFY